MVAMRVTPQIEDYGVTAIEILTGKIPCHRYNEIQKWLNTNMPYVKSISAFNISAEPGAEKWRRLVTKHGAKSLPQIVVTQDGEMKYIGELQKLMEAFPLQSKEACTC